MLADVGDEGVCEWSEMSEVIPSIAFEGWEESVMENDDVDGWSISGVDASDGAIRGFEKSAANELINGEMIGIENEKLRDDGWIGVWRRGRRGGGGDIVECAWWSDGSYGMIYHFKYKGYI